MNTRNLEMLSVVAQGLNDQCAKFVFLGGATVDLYTTDIAASDSRPTMDVDCIIEITSYSRYTELEEQLHRLGFTNDTSEDAPLCRFLYRGIKVDVMSTPFDRLGFNNTWYTEGLQHSIDYMVGPGIRIKILIFPYFLATKLAALEDRGKIDLRTSKDFEDIIFLFRNRQSASDEILGANDSVKEYIVDSVSKLLAADNIDEAISSVLDYGEPSGTVERIKRIMKTLADS